jgi:hypothetical protein
VQRYFFLHKQETNHQEKQGSQEVGRRFLSFPQGLSPFSQKQKSARKLLPIQRKSILGLLKIEK